MKTILKNTAFTAILLMLAGSFASCNKDPFLTVNPTSIEATEGGRFPITVRSNGQWKAFIEDHQTNFWCQLFCTDTIRCPFWRRADTIFGTDNGTFDVHVGRSNSRTPRNLTVRIISEGLSRSVTIKQEAYVPLGDHPCPNDPCRCGIENPAENLPWLKDLISRAQDTNDPDHWYFRGNIWLEKYRGRDIFVANMHFGSGSVMYHYFDCSGNHYGRIGRICFACRFVGNHHFDVEDQFDWDTFILRYGRRLRDESIIIYSPF